jgi:hypothetical protein
MIATRPLNLLTFQAIFAARKKHHIAHQLNTDAVLILDNELNISVDENRFANPTSKSKIKNRMSQQDTQKDYYSVLGAQSDASKSEIDRLYRRQAQQHHPDLGGDEERMKSLNEAYGVLRDDASRRAYDEGRRHKGAASQRPQRARNAPPVVRSQGAQADAVYGRCVGAILLLFAGLALLLLVRFQWIWFLWPLAILAGLVIIFGVLMAHSAMLAMRDSLALSHPARKHTLVQETLFWSIVCGGGYGVYLVLSAV